MMSDEMNVVYILILLGRQHIDDYSDMGIMMNTRSSADFSINTTNQLHIYLQPITKVKPVYYWSLGVYMRHYAFIC